MTRPRRTSAFRNGLLALALLWSPGPSRAQTEVLRLGTLAPESSDWGRVFQEMGAQLAEATGGQVRFRFFWGRDEDDLVALLKGGQLDAVSLTGVGLGQLLPAVSALQLPMLFATYAELDYVRERLASRLAEQFAQMGYGFLGWGEIGFVHLFSTEPIRTQTDLQKTRIWVRATDPIARAFAAESGQEPVPLPLEGVLPALAANQIQTVYSSPMACIVYQWHARVKYMTDVPLAAGVAATLVDQGRLARLSEAQRDLVRAVAASHHARLVLRVRQRNAEAVRVLEEEGIQVVSMPHEERAKWRQVAQRVQGQFSGKLYEASLLEEMRRLLEEHRGEARP